MLEDSAEALDETLVATLDNLCVSSCFLAAARETSESSLFEGVGILIGVTKGVELVGCDVIFGSPGTTFGRDERRPLSSLRLMSSLVSVTFDVVAASRIVRRKVTNCSSCDLKKIMFFPKKKLQRFFIFEISFQTKQSILIRRT